MGWTCLIHLKKTKSSLNATLQNSNGELTFHGQVTLSFLYPAVLAGPLSRFALVYLRAPARAYLPQARVPPPAW